MLRILLVLPLGILALLAAIVALPVGFVAWCCALVLGRLPGWAVAVFTAYIAWTTRLSAYLMLVTDRYPGLSVAPSAGTVRVEFRAERVNRWVVLVRCLAALPASIVSQALAFGWTVAGFPIWVSVLVCGRLPPPLFEATAAVLRVQLRTSVYLYMFTDAYPLVGLYGEPVAGDPPAGVDTQGAAAASASRTRPLLLDRGARILVTVFLVLGLLLTLAQAGARVALIGHLGDLEGASATYRVRNDFAHSVDVAVRRMAACRSLPCERSKFRTVERAAHRASVGVREIDYPLRVRQRVVRARRALARVARSAHEIRTAPRSRFLGTLRGSRIDPQIHRAILVLTRLGKALR